MEDCDGEFRKELAELINKHCKENIADTPDFLLADFLNRCLNVFGYITKKNLDWHGTDSICHSTTKEDTKTLLYELMGYCSARYSVDADLALSEEDIKTIDEFTDKINQHLK